jgi:response regulator RpfG family c-di-GMP phosphodiesterase
MPERQDSLRILIVDDDESVRTLLLRQLSTEPFLCETAPSPSEALGKIRSDHFALVISDMIMPGMSGIELLKHIQMHDPEIAVIIITGNKDLSIAVDSLRLGAFDFITKPFDLPAISRAVQRALERRQLAIENRFYQEELERKVQERTLELNNATKEVEESYKITLEALVTALDAREHETHAHSQRVREYTITLAKSLGMAGQQLIHTGRGALLHDVGKIGVPDSILLKPGKLTPAEWVEMRKHPRIGFDILESIQFLAPAAEIVLAHQERWDGKGYPHNLGGEDIPLGARIFAVADTLDAITSDRPYRKARTFSYAFEEIRRGAGSQFDPSVVEVFLSIPAEIWTGIRNNVDYLHQNIGAINTACLI